MNIMQEMERMKELSDDILGKGEKLVKHNPALDTACFREWCDEYDLDSNSDIAADMFADQTEIETICSACGGECELKIEETPAPFPLTNRVTPEYDYLGSECCEAEVITPGGLEYLP